LGHRREGKLSKNLAKKGRREKVGGKSGICSPDMDFGWRKENDGGSTLGKEGGRDLGTSSNAEKIKPKKEWEA